MSTNGSEIPADVVSHTKEVITYFEFKHLVQKKSPQKIKEI